VNDDPKPPSFERITMHELLKNTDSKFGKLKGYICENRMIICSVASVSDFFPPQKKGEGVVFTDAF
jgi:hypothetical protein